MDSSSLTRQKHLFHDLQPLLQSNSCAYKHVVNLSVVGECRSHTVDTGPAVDSEIKIAELRLDFFDYDTFAAKKEDYFAHGRGFIFLTQMAIWVLGDNECSVLI